MMRRAEKAAYLWVAIASALYAAGATVLGADPWDAGIAAGLLAVVTLLISGVFGQPGTIKLSPQRAAAIAAGREDRKTIFERRATQPVMWVLLTASHSLVTPRLKAWVRKTLIAAGSPNYYTAEEYLAVGMATGLALAGVLEVMYFLGTQKLSFIMLLLGLAGGIGLTLYQLHDKAQKRLATIARRVPYALDLISLAMGAGANFAEAVKTIVREREDDPLNQELKTVLAEMELGTTRRRALENLARRVPMDAMRSIVASVIQAEELGTPLGTVLHDQATLLRLQRSVRAENRAAIASVRILIPCLLLVVAVMLAVFGPAIIRAVRKGLF
jgi:tight adherence protein C